VGGVLTFQPKQTPVLGFLFFNIWLQPIYWVAPIVMAWRWRLPRTGYQFLLNRLREHRED